MSTIGKSNANRVLACFKGSVSDFSLLSIPPRIKKYLIALRSQKFFIGRENGVFQQNRPIAELQPFTRSGHNSVTAAVILTQYYPPEPIPKPHELAGGLAEHAYEAVTTYIGA